MTPLATELKALVEQAKAATDMKEFMELTRKVLETYMDGTNKTVSDPFPPKVKAVYDEVKGS